MYNFQVIPPWPGGFFFCFACSWYIRFHLDSFMMPLVFFGGRFPLSFVLPSERVVFLLRGGHGAFWSGAVFHFFPLYLANASIRFLRGFDFSFGVNLERWGGSGLACFCDPLNNG